MPETQWDAVWVNANIATMVHGKYSVIREAAIAVSAGVIDYVGPMTSVMQALEAYQGVCHDVGGRWITPGLIDCHTHIVYAGTRAGEFEQRLQGSSYAEIAEQGGGIKSTVEATRAADFETLYQSAARRLKVLLAEGVTAVEIKSGYGLDLDTEMKMLRVARALGDTFPVTVKTTYLGAHTLPPGWSDADAYIAEVCTHFLPIICEQGLADRVDVFCERIGFNLAQTEHVFKAARRAGLPVVCHAEQLSDSGGVALAVRYGALSVDHLEYLSPTGVKALAQSGAVAVLLPGAFYFLQEQQKPPVDALRSEHIPMAIATDSNPGSSPCCSLLLMLNMACVQFGLTPEEALAGVTTHAAKALGLARTEGTLAAHKVANFVVWDIEHPAELSYSMGFNPCQSVIKSGELC